MNWYKVCQQLAFDFWRDEDSRWDYGDKRPQELLPTPELEEGQSFDEAVEDCTSMAELMNLLKFHADDYELIEFPNKEKVVTAIIGGKTILIEVSDNDFSVKDPQEWLRDISWGGRAWEYLEPADFSEEFWESVDAGSKLYHGTTGENAEIIKREGISPRYGTRGIDNRSTGAAVFTSSEPETATYHYDVVFVIDVGSMKVDGYMPQVSMEEPVQEAEWLNALANKIGLEDYYHEVESGLDPGTVIFYGAIPAKYLSVIKE